VRWIWLVLVIVILDQLTKLLASHYLQLHQPLALLPGLNLTLTHNTGAAFSFLSNAGGWQRWLFIALAVVLSVIIFIWLLRLPGEKKWLACALALVLGGALGNLWDRVYLSYVIDFIDVYYGAWHWPAFNVADSSICIGAAMLIIDTLWLERRNP